MESTHKQAYIFFGPQGAGKGTQKKLVIQKLADSGVKVVQIEPGQFFRDMITSNGYTNAIIKGIQNTGKLQPDFLPIYVATKTMIEEYAGDQVVILDGVPRKRIQAEAIHEMLQFYGISAKVISLTLNEQKTVERLTRRGREDDTKEAIRERLRLYHQDTKPLLDFFAQHPGVYDITEIDGDQSVEEVFATISAALSLDL